MQTGVYGIVFTSRYDTTPSNTVIYNEQDSGACALYDLTLMFGAGNEPSTIEEFNARKPIVADEYAYNEGEVIHCNTESIKSVGDNAWDEQWRQGYYVEGTFRESSSQIASANPIKVLPNQEYYINQDTLFYWWFYDEDMKDLFVQGENGKLLFNPDYSKLCVSTKPDPFSDSVMKATPAVIRYETGQEYEGIYLYINKNEFIIPLILSDIEDILGGYDKYAADAVKYALYRSVDIKEG
jgi:hypothetical protein